MAGLVVERGDAGLALVTGGSGGIGSAVCTALAALGFPVAVHYCRHPEAAAGVAATIRTAGGAAWPVGGDLSVGEEAEALFTEIDQLGPPLTVVVHCAGTIADCRLERLAEAEWDSVVASNLTSAWQVVRLAGRRMARQRDGHILLVSSIGGVQGRFGQANYAAAKAGEIGLAKAAARELGSRNVRVNAVIPGFLETPMTAAVPARAKEAARAQNCLGRLSSVAEVARAIALIATLRDCSGQLFNLDSRIL